VDGCFSFSLQLVNVLLFLKRADLKTGGYLSGVGEGASFSYVRF